MPEAIVLECPICSRRRAFRPSETSAEDFVDALGAHVLSAHPDEPPGAVESVVERSLERPEREEVPEEVTAGGWHREL